MPDLRALRLRLVRVVDLTNRAIIRTAGILSKELSGQSYTVTREIGLRAWENGVEALLLPSAANPVGRNLAVFLDNQHPVWSVELLSNRRTTKADGGYLENIMRRPPASVRLARVAALYKANRR